MLPCWRIPVVVSIVSSIVGTMVNVAGAEDNPPWQPQGERILRDDSKFSQQCLAEVRRVFAGVSERWLIRAPTVSESDRWGTIWRAEFTVDSPTDKKATNRIMCWQRRPAPLQILVAFGPSYASEK